MNSDHILDRAKEAMNIEQDQELAARLSVSRSTIAAWRRRGSIPAKYLSKMVMEGTVSLDWLLTGQGDRMSVNREGVAFNSTEDAKPFAEKEVIWLSLLLIRRELIQSSHEDQAALGKSLSDDLLATLHIGLANYIRRVTLSRKKWLSSGIIRPNDLYNSLVAEYGFGHLENPPPPWWEHEREEKEFWETWEKNE